ncbi:IS66 family insertion sequence element accessory protein TnpB [Rhizobium sp. NLR17b]|nr:IS66 family insertion sequence element accessory protein TnpB [Rhizobium sp. NLR17b]
MIGVSPNGLKIMVATQPVDFRRSMNGLVALVTSALAVDPYCGDMFVFRAKRLIRLRCIYWDGSGMILATKWLEAGMFVRPPIRGAIGVLCRRAAGRRIPSL